MMNEEETEMLHCDDRCSSSWSTEVALLVRVWLKVRKAPEKSMSLDR